MRKIKIKLLTPINELILNLDSKKIMSFKPKEETVVELKQLHSTLQKMNIEIKKKAQYEAESKTAKQVAHDIRSPLACLNLLLSYIDHLPEKQRILIRSSVQRITDIANTFQNKAKKIDMTSEKGTISEFVMVSSVLESLVTEKRVQLGLRKSIYVNLHLEKGYNLFTTINPVELRRALSNLLDNSIEACSETSIHNINVIIEPINNNILIKIQDDGKGIPEDVLLKIGTYGFSFGKNTSQSSGSGLGVHHAMKTVKSAGGSLVINSICDVGTTASITLPQTPSPTWFVSDIFLKNTQQIVVLDDDPSIHSLWDEKFSQYREQHSCKILHFSSVEAFSKFIKCEYPSLKQNILFLMDFELAGQEATGLELIENLHLENCAILVTSHQDDLFVREKVVMLNTKILPKSIISYISLF